MEKTKVISNKNLAYRLPITWIILSYLLLDKFHAPGWLWGGIMTFWGLCLIAIIIYRIVVEERVDIFEDKS